jgi:hypothetical protein
LCSHLDAALRLNGAENEVAAPPQWKFTSSKKTETYTPDTVWTLLATLKKLQEGLYALNWIREDIVQLSVTWPRTCCVMNERLADALRHCRLSASLLK